MTNDDIDKLEAGPELDALVATRVMGWKLGEPHFLHGELMHGGSVEEVWEGPGLPRADGSSPVSWGFKPSINIAAAWEVVEKLNAKFKYIDIATGDGWLCMVNSFDGNNPVFETEGRAITAPLAICRAALKAKESEQG